MKTVTGQLSRVDLGGGVWSLLSDSGRRFTLIGDVPEELTGQQVEVQGVEEHGMGFGMTGAHLLLVEAIRPISG